MYVVPYQLKLLHAKAVVSPVEVAIFCVIETLAVDVQPFVPVAVTVKLPGAVMLAAADDPKLLFHE